jgi:hypothetical protein
MACLFAATFVVVYLAPNLWIIAGFFVLSRIGVSLWLFNLYNYTAVAYPTPDAPDPFAAASRMRRQCARRPCAH